MSAWTPPDLRPLSKAEQLKQRIHSAKVPLGRGGQALMMCVYVGVPIVAGYGIMWWTQSRVAVKTDKWIDQRGGMQEIEKQRLRDHQYQHGTKVNGGKPLSFADQVALIKREAKNEAPIDQQFAFGTQRPNVSSVNIASAEALQGQLNK